MERYQSQSRDLLGATTAEAAQAAPSAAPSPAEQYEVIHGDWIIVTLAILLMAAISFAILARRFGWRALLRLWKRWLCCTCLCRKKAGANQNAELVPLSQQSMTPRAHSNMMSQAPVEQSMVSNTSKAPLVQYRASDWMVPAGFLKEEDLEEEPEPLMAHLLHNRPKYKSSDYCHSNADVH
ncbi:hypothetical protein COCOBI_06-3730 [Coccomyxa sp. Obi]|nr:hypothetical protein COCOBI_06-3730 [Coccomyxa sp. Obi]